MLPETILAISAGATEKEVSELPITDIEKLSISDISSVRNAKLRDLLNRAVSKRLAHHLGGSYTSPDIQDTVGRLTEVTQ